MVRGSRVDDVESMVVWTHDPCPLKAFDLLFRSELCQAMDREPSPYFARFSQRELFCVFHQFLGELPHVSFLARSGPRSSTVVLRLVFCHF